MLCMYGYLSTPTLGTYAAVRNVEFCIEQLKDGLTVTFKDRLLSLDSKSSCSLKVGLHAKINLVGVKLTELDLGYENGDPEKSDYDSSSSDINKAYDFVLTQLANPYIGNKHLSASDYPHPDHKTTMDQKRFKIIEAIKRVCEKCCCNRAEDDFCIKPSDVSEAVKQVCKDCCCRKKESCVDSSKIMEHVNQLCVNCCCKKDDCCNTEGVLSQIEDFCVCVIKEAKEKLDDCTCSGCSSCQENCIDKQKLMAEILKLCSCSEAKKVVEQAAQKCDSCKGSGSCQCCQEAKKQFESCPCMACNLKTAIDEIKGKDDSNCCNSSSCSCSDPNCRKRTDVLDALKTYCKCKDQVKQIKEKIEPLCQSCKKRECCDVKNIESQIKSICENCDCKQMNCCDEGKIKSNVKTVIESKCTCKKQVCCFNKVTDANQSLNTDEQGKLKKIALAIFKYFRPPIAYETGVMTLKSTKDIDLEFLSSSSNEKITVDSKNNNALKIPKQAFKDLIASAKMHENKVKDFHPNSMLSIKFHGITLTFCTLSGEGFCIDGYSINGSFSMQLGYLPAGIFTRNSANWRKKTGSKPNEKHDLSWSLTQPLIDPSKCSCSILSDPLFGTVFGAICISISIVQFIIALFVSQGYYDGFQSYMDAVRSGFSWPTQYDNVVKSVFCGCFLNAIGPSFFADSFSGGAVQSVRVLVGTQNVNGTSFRQVEFCIQELKDGLTVTFKDRLLSLDSGSDCKLKVSLHAKINLVGSRFSEPDTTKDNGDPDKNGSDSDITQIDESYQKMLDELVSPSSSGDTNKKSILDGKRKNIIDAIKDVCSQCCCNRTEEQYCIKPSDISKAVKDVCAQCCCKNNKPCVDSSKIMDEVKKLCQNCCCKQKDCCGTEGVLSQIGEFCVCLIKDAKEKLENCTCDSCSSCQGNCIDKTKLKKEILKLCSCSEAKKVVEQAAQKCDSCKGSGGSCECCQEIQKQFESCPCMACDLHQVIDEIKQDDGSKKCSDPNCSCSSDSGSNCCTEADVLSALNAYCKCKDQVKQIKEKINGLCKHCNKNKCCDVTNIQSDIEQLCKNCPCKQMNCCDEGEIRTKVDEVIQKHCLCRKNKCCFNGIQNGDLSNKTDEQTKLKNIAKAIFKYFRPPIAYETGLMTLSSETKELCISSSGGDKITVDAKNKNVLKIPKQAFQSLMASTKINQDKVKDFHPNSMMSIKFHGITLTFCTLSGEGFCIDGFPINGGFSMNMQYAPAGIFTRKTALWRNIVGDNGSKKHDLSFGDLNGNPRIDPSKCSCSILSDPLFGTVFGAICISISIVQFIIALFVSQGYYDGFQSYMDAVRSGFSWPTQYDNVVNSVFWVLVGTQNVNGTSFRQVEFCIQELKEGLNILFKDRLLSLDSVSDCKLKVSLHAKINLVGSRFSEPDTTKDNGDPDKNGSDSDINEAYQKMLDDLVNFSSNDSGKMSTMNLKRKNIIDAIKEVCKDCCCRMTEPYCVQAESVASAIKQLCTKCCTKKRENNGDETCIDVNQIITAVGKLCVNCHCKDTNRSSQWNEVEKEIDDFYCCHVSEIKEKLASCKCSGCSTCSNSDCCFDKEKLIEEIKELCCCDKVKNALQSCSSCSASGSGCQCCQEAKKQLESCQCRFCTAKKEIEQLAGSSAQCCSDPGCSCSTNGGNCVKKAEIEQKLNGLCQCKKDLDSIKSKIDEVSKKCNENKCCNPDTIKDQIKEICKTCECRNSDCCNEDQIKKRAQKVIESSCKCRTNKCCFRDVNTGDLSSHSKEQAKLKNIAKNIFKYFRPPIAYETGVMTLSSETKELCISSSGGDKITVDAKNKNVLKIPKQAFQSLMASAKMHENKVKDFHPNSMMSIKFHGITLTFCTLSGEGFCIDGFPINGGFSMNMQYAPAGIFTRKTALWRNIVGDNGSKKHDLSFGDLNGNPRIDPSKCSCSILSDPLFGTVFGAICISISIVQFIIALFVSQGYYDGFQSYMDAVRSGFSWPTQYDNVVNSVFWVLVGTQNVNGTSFRQVEFCIQELKEGLNILFKDRLLSLDSVSDCKLKVSLHAKINLVGSRFSEPDTTKDNGDPDKNGSDSDINEAYQKMLDDLVNFSSNDSGKMSTMNLKRKNIIDAIKEVCKDCCCRMTEPYCVQAESVASAIKQLCTKCCTKKRENNGDETCIDVNQIITAVGKLCVNCHCKDTNRSSQWNEVEKEIDDFYCCHVSEIKEKLASCKCSGCSTCSNSDCCFDKEKLIEEIKELCCCDKVKNALQSCSSCSASGSGCQCCQEAKKQLESCQCRFCTAKKEIEQLAGSSAQCCSDPGCSCSTNGGNCVKKAEIEQKLNGLCQCKKDLDSIKSKIDEVSKKCNENKCCNPDTIKDQIKEICKTCECRNSDCCNEDQIKKRAQKVIESSCKCRTNKCCFRDVNTGDLSSHSKEQAKLKNIAKNIFKYFRPPIAYETGVMTLSSETKELCISSSGGDKITVDAKNKNVLKIPKQAFQSLMASAKMHENKVKDFHPNSMLSIKFEEICLTFQEFTGTGFCIDGYSINGSFSMQLGYLPAGIFTRNSANWRKKNSNKSKHELSFGDLNGNPRIDPSKCSCSILSDPLFGTVFGAICLTISIVQFIIALFVSQGYYDGFQSYMDAVRSGFSWPTQYDNVVNSVFWHYVFPHAHVFSNLLILMLFVYEGFPSLPTLGTYEAVRNVEFWIEQLKDGLTVTFKDRLLSLDSKSSCSLKVGLHAKINLVGVKLTELDLGYENGDPEKSDYDSSSSDINKAYDFVLTQLANPYIGNKHLSASDYPHPDHKTTMDQKRFKIIEAIKRVCEKCCCNRAEDDFCIKPSDVSEAVKQVCKDCCCRKKESCVDSSKIMEHVNQLCVNCCCKKDDCCNTEGVLSQIEDFCVCVIKEAKEKLDDCTCSGCSSCQENCIDKQKLMAEILKLCSCSEAKKVVEQAAQKCDSCKGSGSCQCCQEAKKQFESCPCMACNLKTAIDEIKGKDDSNCCNSSSCSCSDPNCRKRTDVLDALKTYCKCKDQVKQIKEKIEPLCQSCKKRECCDVKNIESQIKSICENCDCKQMNCCDEGKIKSNVKTVIESKCTCKKQVCCFNKVTDANQSLNTDEQGKLKKIALAIFKYFRPPIAYETGVMTLKSTKDIDLEFLSSSSNEKITVDSKNNNALKIPKQAFKDLIASAKMHENKVKDFHPNSMLSIKFHGITLTFCTLSGEGFCIDGYSINGSFSMQLGYLPAGIFTRNSANWRKKTGSKPNEKHDLSWSLTQPLIDPSKCSCSILSDPLFGTVFGAICISISIVQFIIALFVSQGYYDGFQSYMDAVRSGFSWPTQYDNVVKSVFCGCFLNAIGPSFFADVFSGGSVQSVRVLVGTQNVDKSFRQVDFCIEQLKEGLNILFKDRLLSLDSGSDCKLKVSLLAKINLVGVKLTELDLGYENGDPEKSDYDSSSSDINKAYDFVLTQLANPYIGNKHLSASDYPHPDHKTTMDQKRFKIIEAIKRVCEKCCCNRAEDDFCIKPSDVSEAVKQVCKDCCCRKKESCVDSSKIMEHVNQLCVNCCCKKDDCCNTEGVLSQIEDFCVCVIKEAKEKLDDCTCSGCSSCQENCIDKQKLMAEILKLCSCSEAKKVVEQAAQKCDSCKGSGSCQCCQEAKKQFESCPCMACNLKTAIDEIKGKDDSNCCNSSSCSCSDPNCRKRTDVLDALKTYCKCKDQVKQIKEKIEPLCQSCKKRECCDVKNIESQIKSICENCDCKQMNCCDEGKIKSNVKTVIESKCTCKKQVCCFNKVTDANQSLNTDEQGKLKKIALAIFKYFRPPIAYETGVMTLKSTKDIDLEFLSSSSNEKITVDSKNNNALKIPKQAFKDLIASAKMHENKVKDFHPNSMLSIKFHGITLTFCTLSGEGFCIDGYSINGSFSMQLGYLPAGIFTRNSANWRKKTGSKPNEKHDLSWSLTQPLIDPSKCSCSILSDPLFGTVFGAICISISIVQFIIALFVSQGYYDGFQSYMDAVRSGFSWPTQYDNVVKSVFWVLVGTQNVPGPGDKSGKSSYRHVEFCIEQLKEDLLVKFENRVLSLDSGSDCKLKVSLHAKINLVGVKWFEPDTMKWNENGSNDSVVDSAYSSTLGQLISPSIGGKSINTDSTQINTMNSKRLNIINAIKEVCKSCCCNRKEDEFCIQPTDISQAVKQVCASCCCKSKDPCVDSSKIINKVKELCVDCCCKKDDCCGTNEVLSQIEDFCVCLIKEAKEKLENCTCDSCSDCQENCIDKQKLMKEIEQLCSCSEAKKVVEEAPQKCDSCKASGSCKCCQAVQEKFKDCPCMACDLQQVIDEIKGKDDSKCCNSSSCPCSDPNCRKRTDVLDALKTYCKCKDQVKQIKEKINGLCKQCNKNTCCDSSLIQSDIEKICNSCPCKTHPKCCNESEINKKVQQVIQTKCTCKKNKCCFRDITGENLIQSNTQYSDEQGKLKKIALEIFKYFRPPAAYETGVMTLKSTTDIELEFSSGSSSGDDKITVDSSKNVLKIPKQAFKDLMASSQIPQVKVDSFHRNTMLSIHFEEISLTFQKLNGTGFEIDGYPINGTFLMQLGYQPIGPYTKNSANMRKKTENEPKKHNLSWSIDNHYPQIDKNKCSCSILSNPLFGTVFGAICLTISIVQFIIALFVSQGYYDGFQSYMDAVRSGFSWPTQYDNVASSIFCGCFLNAIGPSFFADAFIGGSVQSVRVQVGTQNVDKSFRNVEFCIQELKDGLLVKFENRVLTLASSSDCKLKVSLHAKINLVGSRFSEPDTTKDNGDPDKNGSDSDINEAYQKMLDDLVNFSSNDSGKMSTMNLKRKNIIDAIKEVCKDCCCRMTEPYCVQAESVASAIKQLCTKCCTKKRENNGDETCIDVNQIITAVGKLCVNCHCKDTNRSSQWNEVEKEIDDFYCCHVSEIKEKLASCKCSGCSTCSNSDCCFDKEKLIEEIKELCCCDKVKNALQSCSSCSASGSGCQCCQEAKKQLESCQCRFCTAKKEIEQLAGSSAQCCSDPGCSCSTNGGNCVKKAEIEQKLNGLCQCKKDLDSIKSKIDEVSKKCNENKCCNPDTIKDQIKEICKTCECRNSDCCNEDQIKKRAQKVIESSCKCRTNKCCFRDVNTGDLSSHSKEQAKLKNIAKNIFKYFRPPIAYETGVMTLSSETKELCISSSGGDKITVDAKNKNVLKIPKQAFQSLMASAKMHENKVKDFHPNSMLSIKFEEICLTFQEFTGTGFCIDGYSINGSFSMQLGYLPAGIFTRNSANWRKKNSNKSKHELSFGDLNGNPRIDPSKCSCSILSDPLFGTVFGAICLTISIVQFIIALFVSQGYYDGFQSYMDAVRSGFSWPTQYDNVVNSVFWHYVFPHAHVFSNLLILMLFVYEGFPSLPTLGTYEAVRNVEFWIEQLKDGLTVTFKDRLLSLDSKSSCSLKVGLHAKINLVGVKLTELDLGYENGDPEKSDYDSSSSDINKAYDFVLTQLANPYIGNKHLSASDYPHPDHKTTMDQKRFKIIEAIKRVCEKCCCNRAEDDFCIKPSDVSEAVKQVCKDCCCRKKESCVDSSKIMEHVNQLCVNCCCKKDDCCNTEGVLSQIEDFCVCVIKEAKEKLDDCTCSGCSSCQENCIDKQKLMAEILKLCSCSEAKKVVEQAAQKCDSCKGSGSCQCCQEAKKQFESCPCMACNLKTAIDEIKGKDDSNCCNSSSCSCSDPNCRKRTDVLDALKTYCKCKDQVKQIKEKIEPLCQSCKKRECCDVKNIESQIKSICENCDCKQMNCCDEGKIKSNVKTVIESKCTCKKQVCCFNKVTDANQSLNTDEQGKLKKIALAIFKYFRPPIAYETGVMTLKSTKDIDLEFLSSSSNEKITVDSKNNNALKIPKQAFKDLIASAKMHENKVKDFHPNSMLSIKFHGITLTFCTLSGEGFCIDGYSINGSFSMQLGYLPAGIFTRNSANWRKKTGSKPNEKHDLSWSLTQPLIDPSKCSCSILSDPLFGTVFGAICISISIVQFIIALFVSQGYYDGFQSYMDAVRSGFSWPTQYDNVVKSVFWQVEFCIQELQKEGLKITFENRVLSLDSGSDCKLKVSLHAKINLVGSRFSEPDTTKDNGDPDKNGSDSEITDIDNSYQKMLDDLVNFSSSDQSKVNTMNAKRKNIIDAIKDVCKDCSCGSNCCFKDITDGDLSKKTAEKEKLKNIAKEIFKYFRPPIAHSTGVMTLKSTKDIELEFSSSGGDKITVDTSKNVLKIPAKAFKDLMASTKINQVKVTTFHKNTMLSIHFEEISLTFQKLNGTGFEIDGYPINGTFSMQLGYQPIGPYTKNSANWRKKTENEPKKHNLSWGISSNHPRIDPSKCSCSILSDPLFGTVFGAICLTISIVQFIIALFVSQGYYDGFQSYMDAVRSGFSWPTQYDNVASSIFWHLMLCMYGYLSTPTLGTYAAVREVNFSIQELNNDIEIQFDNRVLSLPANSSCSIQVSLEAKIGLVGVKKPVADVDEENGNGLESGFEDVISSVLKELIEPTLNGSQEGKSKMNSKRLNIINAIKEVCKSCCCYKNRECLEASDISLAVTQFCKDCCSKDPKCCNTDDVLKQLKDFCVCPVKEIMEKNFENTQCKDVCKCHEKSTCCSKAVIEAFLYDLCPFKEARSVLHICPEHKSNEETCCGNGKNCKCTQKVKDKLALCGCKFCKIKKDLNEGFFNSEENKCQDCSGHECYLKDKFLQWLKKHCDCKVNREDITQAIQALSEKCKGKTCCNSEEIKTAVQSVITEKCQCTKMNCCFKNISNGDDLAVEKEDKANEKDILKNIAKEIFNYYKPPEPKTTGFIVLNSCKSKTLTLCSNNDGNGEKSNEHICVSSDNLKIYNEAFKDLKAFTKISSAYVSEFHPNSKIMIAFQSVTLKFCDFCSNGNEGFKIDGFPVNQRFSMTIQYRSPTPFLDKAANWKNISNDSDTKEEHHALTYNSFHSTGPLMDTFNCSCSVPCDSFLGSSCGSECFAVSTMYLFIALFISHGYYIGFQSYLDAVQSGFSWPTQFDDAIKSIFWWTFLALRNGFKLFFGMYNMDILGVVC
ncbi:hypothetical protein BdWA1_002858 [Babesia duncani]|uniref:Uncharacterized protein n=1 Tax=Babesia duncani TaxID=323732 RepID=A0AAD9PHZ0_9APIC|nr:hypothetical protein BdWA1_002858 [Babesia duncani]